MARKSRLMEPLPWYRWNPSKWQGSRKVGKMSWAERGLYRELMDECWIKGSVPSTTEGIADMLGADEEEISALLPGILRCFCVREDQTMTNEFIEQVRTEMDGKRIAAREKALGRKQLGADNCAELEQRADNRSSAQFCTGVEERRVSKEREEIKPDAGSGCSLEPALPGQGGCDVF